MAEPVFIWLWIRIRINLMLLFPITEKKLGRVDAYFRSMKSSHRFGIMMPLRRRIRMILQVAGVAMVTYLAYKHVQDTVVL